MTHKTSFCMFCCCAILVGAVFGCVQKPEVKVKADFATDKEVYNLYDEVILTNLSSADGASLDVFKWEWGEGNVSYETVPSIAPTSDRECTFRIKLTAVASSVSVGDTCSRVIRFTDGNVPPKADFSWSPTPVYIGRLLQFTDASIDSDGRIVSWLWNIGGVDYTEQNPAVFAAPDGKVNGGPATKTVIGDIDPLQPPVQMADTLTVSLKVTDNGFKTDSLTRKILIYNEED